jgi:hypothetical protein
MQKRESGLTAWEFRKGKKVGEEGAFQHAAEIEYRFYRVRELRRHGAKQRTSSTGCIEQKRVQAGSGKELLHKGSLETAEDRLLERQQLFLWSLPDGRPRLFTLQGCGIWRAPSEYQLRPGSTGRLEHNRKTTRGTAAQRGAYKPVDNGGIVAVELSALGSNQGQPGHLRTGGSCIGARVRAARCPRSFGPLFQSIPRPWGVTEYRNGIGATKPTRSSRSGQ